ncbi:MAG: NUDIX hydrolase [Candidatus Paceibacterota bacterium]|jgi:ADP-ribose pyrophosphatase YjhB (NUDIX family)
MQNYFQGNSKHPQHISVGAILLNEKNEICCHHFDPQNVDFTGYWRDQNIDSEFYILMRETVEPNETLEETLHRGLKEEFGAEAELVDYVGSIESHFQSKGVTIEKTTLYFICKLKNQDAAKRSTGDVEFESQIEWQTAEFLIPKMQAQSLKYGRTDIDESKILERININEKSVAL